MRIADVTLPIGQTALDQELPGAQHYTPTDEGFGQFFSATMAAVLVIAALLVLLYMTWGAIEWITSGGDKGKTEKARDKITQSAIGLLVLASVLAIFSVLQQFLGLDSIILPEYDGPSTSTIRGVGVPATGTSGTSVPGTTGAATGGLGGRIREVFGRF